MTFADGGADLFANASLSAAVLLLAYVGRRPAKLIKIHTFHEPQVVVLSNLLGRMSGIPKSYAVRVAWLTPYRKIGRRIRQADDRVELDISVAA